jgi:eukaryotic-like serine/threonine-protein kinase
MLENVVNEGDLIAGKYRVEKLLGAGGMGVVVSALHLQLDERVAIKLLLPEMLKIPEAVQRFTREARAAVKIKNEHVARVFDVGTLDGGAPYMVMEYLEGGDLAAWLENRGPLPVDVAVDFVLQACEAIADAHALGIVHRDLKPANLFCTRRSDGAPAIKVLDFGISRMSGLGGSSDLGLTHTSAMMGSPRYMSPEQMQTPRAVDSRTDIWAMGAILYELISGSVPFPGETLPEICLKITTAEPEPLASLRAGVPAGLEAVIAKCLAKDRERRYPDIASLAAALAPFASHPGRAAATAADAGPRPGRNKLVFATLAGAIAVGGGALVWSAARPAAIDAPAAALAPPVPAAETAAASLAPGPPPIAEPAPPPPPAPPVPDRAPAVPEASKHRAAARRLRKASPPTPPPAASPAAAKPAAPHSPPPPHATPRGLIDDRR